MEEYEPEFTITITYDNFLTRSENFFYSTSIVLLYTYSTNGS